MALPLEAIEPVTVNIALNLRTRVTLFPFEDGWAKVSSEGFPGGEQYPYDCLPFMSPFGLFFSALSHFGFHGLEVRIRSDSPVKSALGGSSTALIALIKALSELRVMLGEKRLSGKAILHLGYHLEDGVSGGNCGIQDQAAAVYGGVNRWRWRYGTWRSLFKRESLLGVKGRKELSKRILVAYSGKSHFSSRINRTWVNDFLSGVTRVGWVKVNDLVHRLAEAIKEEDWNKAATLLRDEMAIRREITPDALIPITEKLIDQAESKKCGARFTGAGAGGSIWALGEVDRIRHLREIWEMTLAPIKTARILDCHIDPIGVR
jgi:D-glycero-alpha-D-manno-heptose-7-phosphate kinase